MSLHSTFLLLFFTNLIFLVHSTTYCPPSEQFRPCRCQFHNNKGGIGGSRTVSCSGISFDQLKETLNRVAKQNTGHLGYFATLHLYNLTSDTIGEGALNGLTFKNIVLQKNNQLKKVHVNAFANQSISILEIKKCPNLTSAESAADLFAWINSMQSVKHIEIVESSLTTISKLNLPNMTFFDITLNQQPLSIESNAFYGCPKLEHLRLKKNQISFIGPKSLRLQNSTKSTWIMLNENSLTSNSFAVGSLANFNRPVKLSLWNNEIRVIEESVFRPFLTESKQNNVSMLNNPIDCNDCRNFWAAKEQVEFQKQFELLYCDGPRGKSFFKHDWSKCQNN